MWLQACWTSYMAAEDFNEIGYRAYTKTMLGAWGYLSEASFNIKEQAEFPAHFCQSGSGDQPQGTFLEATMTQHTMVNASLCPAAAALCLKAAVKLRPRSWRLTCFMETHTASMMSVVKIAQFQKSVFQRVIGLLSHFPGGSGSDSLWHELIELLTER